MKKNPYDATRIDTHRTPGSTLSRDALAVVKRAAELQGRSVSDFVVAAAQEAAWRDHRGNQSYPPLAR